MKRLFIDFAWKSSEELRSRAIRETLTLECDWIANEIKKEGEGGFFLREITYLRPSCLSFVISSLFGKLGGYFMSFVRLGSCFRWVFLGGLCAVVFLFQTLDINAESDLGKPVTDKAALSAYRREFISNRCIAFGGMGIVAPDTYVVTSSKKNEIRLPGNVAWEGEGSSKKQVVCILDGKVFDYSADRERFSLTKSTLISFEGEKVYFFDFNTFKGGYYVR